MNKILVGIVIVVVLIAGVILVLSRGGGNLENTSYSTVATPDVATPDTASSTDLAPTTPQPSTPIVTPPPAQVSIPAPTTEPSFTMTQVQMHNSKSDCWSAINGKIYDLTSWIGQHPGGKSAIISICGKDGSAAFNDQHGGQSRPANELDGFFIGILI